MSREWWRENGMIAAGLVNPFNWPWMFRLGVEVVTSRQHPLLDKLSSDYHELSKETDERKAHKLLAWWGGKLVDLEIFPNISRVGPKAGFPSSGKLMPFHTTPKNDVYALSPTASIIFLSDNVSFAGESRTLVGGNRIVVGDEYIRESIYALNEIRELFPNIFGLENLKPLDTSLQK